MTPGRPARRARLVAGAAALAGFWLSAGVAHALWATTAVAGFTVTTAAVPSVAAPGKPGCTWAGSTVTLSWDAVPGALSYRAYQEGSDPIAVVAEPTLTLIEAQMPKTSKGGKYTVTVRAYDGTYSDPSPPVEIAFRTAGCR